MRDGIIKVNPTMDLIFKRNYIFNSFYASGTFNLEGHKMDYLFHIMAVELPGKEIKIGTYFVLADQTKKEFIDEVHYYDEKEVMVSANAFLARTPDSEVSGNIDRIQIHASMDGVSLDINLRPQGLPLCLTDSGEASLNDSAMYNFTYPGTYTGGTITLGNVSTEIKATSWVGREWYGKAASRFSLLPTRRIAAERPDKNARVAWARFYFVFENGAKAMIWMNCVEGVERGWAKFIKTDGIQKTIMCPLVASQIMEFYKKPGPLKLDFYVRELDVHLIMGAIPKKLDFDEELIPMIHSHETLCMAKMKGRGIEPVRGYCHARITGRWL